MIGDVTITANSNNGTRQASTASALRNLVCSNEIAFLMEAHDALSASVAEAAGFRGLWASGLSISSCLGYRDANEASWTEIVDAVHRIVEATQIPVLVDGDSGFGNFNNARLFARKLHQRGAAGVCVEDKSFPKKNSFVADRHSLAEIGEFCGRLQAIRDHVPDPEFVVVARIEALIAGHGQDEALTRAHAYADAGADAILIHSRKPDAAEILAFSRAWRNRLPVVIVPTKYYSAPVAQYRAAQISTVIWANHNMRAAISAMRQVCDRIIREESTAGIERDVATLEDLFDLLKYQELSAAEQKYLPQIASGAR
ncbi:phosphoenolpyruvate mutase [Mesorhizobium captivum]|uniref:phosphoenolpyruvate mutase n=1 Tax=Mesorhizobium captivum TaxID=3072319 RepID=UPI002A2461BD|nr:phosphoenolpyruvate mutase [Mesorhizobium sp. VK23E]MDX8515199.1 phosphoenolpyruvate mutase [Mesorhizobium sp. VK23E]